MSLDLSALLLCTIVVLVPVLLTALLRIPSWVRAMTVTALVLHVLVATTNYSAGWLIAPDSLTYHQQAVDLMNGYDPRLFVAGKEAWPTLLSWLYAASSPTPVIPLVLNASLCSLMVPLIHRLGEACRTGAGKPAVAFLFLMPGWWLWGVIGLREPAVWLLSLVALAFLAEAIRTERLGPMAGFAFAVTLFAWLRGPLALIVAGGGAAAFVVARRPTLQRFIVLAVGMTVTAGLVMGQLSRLAAFQDGTTTSAQTELSGSRTGFGIANPALTAGRILTGPWPWELPQVGLEAAPDMVYVWFALVFTVVGLRTLRARAATYALPALGVLASLAITSGNYGTMIRLRTQALIFLVPLLAAGWAEFRSRRRSRDLDRRPRRAVTGARGPA